MLHHRKNPESVIKSYAYAAVAMVEGAQLLFFSPRTVDFNKRIINGYIYKDGSWHQIESPFPNVIYNTGSPQKLKKSKQIIEKLKKEIPFTSNSIGNKMKVYERFKRYGDFSKYLIPSQIITSTKEFFNFLELYSKIVLKPVNGHKGQRIVFIEALSMGYHLFDSNEDKTLDFNKMKSFISNKLYEESYLVQPYINCKTKSGISYDIRLHVQKNREGKWVITAIYPRFAPSGSIVSNINSGGSTNYLVPFLKQEFGEKFYDIKQYLEQFSLQLAYHIDKIQQECFL